MQLLDGYPDAELVCMQLLASVAPTVTATNDLTNPVIAINRTGGEDDRITDFPIVEIQCFAPTRAITSGHDQPTIPGRGKAWQMAEQCRQILLASIRTHVTYTDASGDTVTALIDNAQKVMAPRQLPYGDDSIRVVTASYRLSMRRPKTTA